MAEQHRFVVPVTGLSPEGDGEQLHEPLRLIVAPLNGLVEICHCSGLIRVGSVLTVVRGVPVTAVAAGWFECEVEVGQRVYEWQRMGWLRLTGR